MRTIHDDLMYNIRMVGSLRNNTTFRVEGQMLIVENRWFSGVVRKLGDDRYKIVQTIEHTLMCLEELVEALEIQLRWSRLYQMHQRPAIQPLTLLKDIASTKTEFPVGMERLLVFYRYQDEEGFKITVQHLVKRFTDLQSKVQSLLDDHANATGETNETCLSIP